jgi:hypothetical protein
VHENCRDVFCQFAQQTYKGGCLGLEPYLEVPVALGEAVEQSHTVPRRDDVQSFPGPSSAYLHCADNGAWRDLTNFSANRNSSIHSVRSRQARGTMWL